MRILFIFLLLTGCARNSCEISIYNLQAAPKIPKVINIEIDQLIKADDGGVALLKNYTTMSHQISAIKQDCQ